MPRPPQKNSNRSKAAGTKDLEYPNPLSNEEYAVVSRALGFGRFEVLRVGGGALQATLAGRLKINREFIRPGDFVIVTAFTFSDQAVINHRYTADNVRELKKLRAIPDIFGKHGEDHDFFEDAEVVALGEADFAIEAEENATEIINVDDI